MKSFFLKKLLFSVYKAYLLAYCFVFVVSCKGQDNPSEQENQAVDLNLNELDSIETIIKKPAEYRNPFTDPYLKQQLMLVLRRIFKDKVGNLWFVGDKVFRYDGNRLVNFSDNEVFKGVTVRQIIEDSEGNLWFGTSNGIIKYDPSQEFGGIPGTFSRYTKNDGLVGNDVWSMIIDRKGILWIGTLNGVCRMEEETFTPFSTPETIPDHSRGVTSNKAIHSITEDAKGNLWFGTNGGAFRYDGVSLDIVSEKEGLCNNAVNDILEDKKGNIWFATHHNGVCFWDGTRFSTVTALEVTKGKEIWSIYEDSFGNIWFPVENEGVYCYDGVRLTNFSEKEGLPMGGVHSITEDKNGGLWFGGFGGLYRYDGNSFVNVTVKGPW